MVVRNAARRGNTKVNLKAKNGKRDRRSAEKAVTKVLPFAEVLEAADHLTEDEQQELVAIVQRRLADSARKRLVAAVEETRREFAAGRCKPVTPDELMREIRK